MSVTTPITELDFDTLKREIIAYIKTNTTFTDYNFEGSALNTIVDMLAFNTHTNAFYANMVHSEGFLDTAQKRSSIVSKAKELGYTPRSSVCSSAYLDISILGPSSDTQLFMTRGTSFTSSNDNGSYGFYLSDGVVSNVVGNTHIFSDVRIISGTPATNLFVVDTISNIRSIFTIPNKSIDTTTLKVFVREGSNSISRTEYFLAKNVYELLSNSNVYFLQESYDGFFQIFFGNNIIGSQPVNGNIIDVDYYVANNLDLSDNCREFTFTDTIANSTSISLVTNQVSFGGSDKESLDSIKFNALKSNSSKNRSVSSSDYALKLKESFNFIKTVSVWGGEDNIPPVYGKVFLSIQPISGYTISDAVKRDVITPVIRSNSVMTIGVEYVDPTYLELYISTKIKYSPTKTTSSKSEIEGLVKYTIENYVSSISTFNKDYLESSLISTITSVDPGIQSVNMSKKVGFKLTPLFGIETYYNKTIFNSIKKDSISSTKFMATYNGYTSLVSIKETGLLDSANRNTLGVYTDVGDLVKEIGYIDLDMGNFNISFNVNSYVSNDRFVVMQFILTSDDVTTSRNQILKMAKTNESTSGLSFNTVVAEVYGK